MNSLVQLLSDLRSRGVVLSVDGDRLICNAPKGAVTQEIRTKLAERKQEILAFLKESVLHKTAINSDATLANLTLSRSQQRLWFVAQLDPENPAYNIVVALRLDGELNRNALEGTLYTLVERHESLRTSFYQKNGEPFARIVDGASWTPSFVDLSSSTPGEAEPQVRKLAFEEARKPFSLDRAPLFRAVLFRISQQHHLLLLVVHHIVADGWSLGILAKELGTLYASRSSEQPVALDDFVFQYRDYVKWEQDAGAQAAAQQMPFWLDRLRGPLPILELPGDHPRPAIQTSRGKRIAITLEALLAEQIRGLCRTTGTTPFMLLLAAFKVLLSRYTGIEDILVGSGTSNRQREEVAPLVGFFVNNLVLRTNLSGDPSFLDLLARVQDTAVSAYAHQDVPFDLLVEKLQPERGLSRGTLVQVMFTFQNVPMRAIHLSGLQVTPEAIDPQIARADLAIEVWPHEDGYRCDFEYNTDIFEESTVRTMQSHYLNFLQQAVNNPSIPISNIAPFSEAEQEKILVTRNRTSAERNNFNQASIRNRKNVAAVQGPQYRSAAEHPLSRSQQRLWFLDQLDPGNPVYNIAVALTIHGALDSNAFDESLKTLVARHESLRTRFLQRDGSPYALVGDPDNWKLDFVDLTMLSQDEQSEETARFVQEEARKPFSLEEGPIFRASLLATRPKEHVVVLVMHHIVSDGWSLGILAKELGLIYESILKGQKSPLQPLQFQFRDFIAWEEKQSELTHAADMRYWREHLAGELAPIDLPTDFPRPSVQEFRGQRVIADLSSTLVDRLQKVSREQNATLFMILFAAFNVFLRHYSRQEDILVGTPTAGRLKRDFEGIVGFFVNNLVLRTDLRGNPSFIDLIHRVQKTALETFEHQSIPFDQLVEELQPERSLDRSPIFQVMFTLQNAPLSPLSLENLSVAPLEFPSYRARYDLAVDIYPFEGNYRCDFEFNSDIFEESTIGRMQQHYLRLLETVVSDPTRHVNSLSLLSESERYQIVEGWNRTEMPFCPYATVPAWFSAQVAKSPDAVAVVMGNRTLSYAELDAESNGLAGILRSHGVGKESVVGIYLQRSPEMIIALLGILKAGAAYLPLDPALPSARVEFLLSDAEVPLILTQTELRDALSSSGVPLLMIDNMEEGDRSWSAEQLAANQPTGENLAYLIYTSGSTGNPKGTEITHHALVNLLASMLREPGLSAGDTLVAVTTLSFDIAGLEIFGPLVCGAKLVLASREQVIDPGLLTALLDSSDATVMQATPSTWRMLIEAGWMGKADLRMWCGGEGLPADLAENLLARGRELWNLYGPTETTIWSAAHRVRNGEDPILIGKPIGNTRMYILDPDGQPVPIGVPGELYIGGDGVARGYWKRPELTESRFLSDPFEVRPGRRMYRTGDLARYRRDGQIQLIGRTDHQIKLRGHRIELGEIESVIERHPDVLQAVVSLHGEGSSGHLIAYVRQVAPDADTAHLRPWLQSLLPEYMVPSAFISLAEIPLTPNGKVDRKRLPQPKASARESLSAAVNPRNYVEEQLVRIWSEILKVNQVSVRDNFFDLGGHSLLLIRVHSRVRQELDADIAVIDLFRYPTIESLASCLERRGSEPTVTAGANA